MSLVYFSTVRNDTYLASRFTSLALRIPPFGASSTLRHVSSFNGSIRGILTVKTARWSYRLGLLYRYVACGAIFMLAISLLSAWWRLGFLLLYGFFLAYAFIFNLIEILFNSSHRAWPDLNSPFNYSPDTCPNSRLSNAIIVLLHATLSNPKFSFQKLCSVTPK